MCARRVFIVDHRLRGFCAERLRLPGLAVIAFAVATSACTASHDVDATQQMLEGGAGGTGQAQAGSAAAGRGGSSGRASAGAGGSSSAGSGGSGPMSCGASCMGSSLLFFSLPACCTTAKTCGLDLTSLGLGSCVEQNAPGNLDASCPMGSFANLVTLQGCCRPDGTCGVMDPAFGLGCTDNPSGGNTKCTPQ